MTKKTLPKSMFKNISSKRISSSAAVRRASITVEAALAIPLFFFAVLTLVFLFEVMVLQTYMRGGLQYAGKKAAAEMQTNVYLSGESVRADLLASFDSSRLARSIVSNGVSGIDCSESYVSPLTGICNLVVKYEVETPFPVFKVSGVAQSAELRLKGWTGYVNLAGEANESELVHVTETGIVYHQDYHCTHLRLSISLVPAGSLATLRNEGGGKYHPCETCRPTGLTGAVYITNHGDRYHSRSSCSGLKRTIYTIPLSEAVGKGACKRCSQ